MFEDAKIGDDVWSVEDEWGTVVSIADSDYPLVVEFGCEIITFMLDGRRWESSKNPTLFWDEIKFEIPKKPLPNLKVDTKVIVWESGEYILKEKRHFKEFNNKGKIVCFINGYTSWTSRNTEEWEYWELAEDNTKDKKCLRFTS